MAMIRNRVKPERPGNLFTKAARRLVGRTDEQRREGYVPGRQEMAAEEDTRQQALGGQRQSRPRSGAGRSVMGKTRLV